MVRAFAVFVLVGAGIIARASVPDVSTSQSTRSPILSSSLLFETPALLADIGDAAYSAFIKPHVVAHAPKARAAVEAGWPKLQGVFDQVMDKFLTTVGMPRDVAVQKYEKVKVQMVMKYATARDQMNVLLEAARLRWIMVKGKLDALTLKTVSKFDALVPKHAGALPYDFGDFMFVVAYFLCVLRILFGVTRTICRAIWKVLCCFCCCGCMCRGKAKTSGKKTAPKGKKGEAQPAVKSAPTPASTDKKANQAPASGEAKKNSKRK